MAKNESHSDQFRVDVSFAKVGVHYPTIQWEEVDGSMQLGLMYGASAFNRVRFRITSEPTDPAMASSAATETESENPQQPVVRRNLSQALVRERIQETHQPASQPTNQPD